MKQHCRPETGLLLACAAPPDEHESRAERIRSFSAQPLDWQYLLALAAAHAVTPLLYWGLNAVRPEIIPGSLAKRFHENTVNSIRMTAALLQLLDLFAREGISVLPMKGPTLAAAVYGNLALRQFVDLDLLVHKDDALRARRILLENGYRGDPRLTPKWEEAYLRVYDEFGLRHRDGFPLVELHWALTPRYFSAPVDIGPFWRRGTSVHLADRTVPALCAEDLFLVLCLHGTKHCWPRLSMISDIAWLIDRQRLQWDEILERGRELGAARMILLAAELARRLFDTTEVPQQVARMIAADAAAQALASKVIARILQPPAIDKTGILKAGWFHMSAREAWRHRILYWVRLGVTPSIEDWQFVDLPSSLEFLYPLVRLPRLILKYYRRT